MVASRSMEFIEERSRDRLRIEQGLNSFGRLERRKGLLGTEKVGRRWHELRRKGLGERL